jgi:hypothetical protein
MPTPATSEAMIVPAVNTTPPAGTSKPKADNNAFSPAETSTPAPIPISDAMIPTANASRRTDVRIWRRLAPSARNNAFSRVRWATVMKNVLKMMKPPTSKAMTANTSMNVLKNWKPARI